MNSIWDLGYRIWDLFKQIIKSFLIYGICGFWSLDARYWILDAGYYKLLA